MVSPAPASPMFWRLNPEVYKLIGTKCEDCGHITYPRKKICPECGGLNIHDYRLGRTGTIHTYCVNWVLPPGLEPPVAVVIVELDGGGMYQGIITEIANPDQVKIGDRVEMVLKKVSADRGLNIYGYKFRLIEKKEA
ncbi:MAG: hypothetical protein A2Y73_08665 [Chloroflexi bacterium RBG_13_56_8]|jgi:uncharacterized OB-fold protein|nr:MAG: hypothetical protein A2Y73_08665 [Chloroflexi bacterium RBG_13_56_8]